ncbi:MAG: peptide deformylase, peptide deformylase [Parcubacteria group bacterium]|nr:peptide deformylase, peptide deformylase [Parcubacteria group bacterium]
MWYGAIMKAIVQQENPVLHEVAPPVAEEEFGTPALTGIVQDLIDALDAEQDGVAIAAPQIGVSKRIFVVRFDRLQPPPEGSPLPPDVGVFINPEFVRVSRRREEMDEGCLSVRGTYGKTYRHERATVRARDVNGARFERGGGGILAQVYQHETDHLDGILFIDHAIETYQISKEGRDIRSSTTDHE